MKRVLIVEDNEKNMYLMNFILSNKNYEVIKAETGEKGVELAIKERPDLILMDIMLPGIDGYETTKRIREREAGGKVPIIAITSCAMTGDREKVMAAGCTGYIEKPIDPETFIPEIEKYL
ncbi:two-component system response regulator [candidate division WOR-1 bacterium RIFOXYA12_FULL_52_29]|uniref:Two-component system response regulator n=1 Tax=candidate division WOR-1 bacterium RIFOXYC12_FULL_54_18 TaxID=1802584 RepID=A0A1F4T619_UNCSA|nr:MAG: two-component system response regulator [candidate division WOR-1 bacterium RIFOXYA2_FULL_51_19]OGC17727.1 MAG: two-component system response regulator [candidate division WOR-1 bacterium RIFOXYA12_FULL_52_29]OGC26584.1 MAG: two-component system response regulator [candidate division WOR-1 bacterium RIFOXYB2_FULL_45_9]OGC28144.1 MAG: two-component system response regulator [candidate division WOR-1 bacterium RIFOXYC12_FULL_54_18]OGC29570.1 MAG: two-component system response regulator [c